MVLYGWPLLVVLTVVASVLKRRRQEPGADWMWAAVLVLLGTIPCWIGAMEYNGAASTGYAVATVAFAAVGLPIWLHGLTRGRTEEVQPVAKARRRTA
ncbi:MAG: hypothetical protein HYY18_20920 [Planctomycetes bacterium]|nr:hypothetical protein [Planctomycetota bacterium]